MREMRFLLAPRSTLIVRGPAQVQLTSGEAAILGAPLKRHQRVIIRSEKQLPIETSTEADLQIALGELGEATEVKGSTIPETWRLAVEALSEMRQGVVAVVGGTDVGKSTFCAYVGNKLIGEGLQVRIVDADVGQAEMGPPATVSCATPSDHFTSLLDLKPDRLRFVGHVTPSYVEAKLIDGVKRLIGTEPEREYLTVINTDGWILGSDALLHKINMISSIDPDIVVGISSDSDLDLILSMLNVRSIVVQSAKEALLRSRKDRRAIRQSGYRRFLEGGSVANVPVNSVQVRKPTGFPAFDMKSINPQFRNLLVGLSDEEGFLQQIGILINADKQSLRIFSKPVESVRLLELGYVKLLVDGTELGFIEM